MLIFLVAADAKHNLLSYLFLFDMYTNKKNVTSRTASDQQYKNLESEWLTKLAQPDYVQILYR